MLLRITNTIGSMRRSLNILRRNLQLWLDFERNGVDKSANTNNATLYTGKCLSFDGVDDVVTIGGARSLKTIALWVNLDSTTEQVINLSATHSIEVSAGTITLNGTWGTTSVYVDNLATTTITSGAWNRLVVVSDAAITADSIEVAKISTNYGSLDISDIEIYDAEWTTSDVDFDYNNPQHLASDNPDSSIALTNLKGYWHLSEGYGTTCYDSSGGGNNGVITGASWLLSQSDIPQLGLMDWSVQEPVDNSFLTIISDPNDPTRDILDNAVVLREHGLNLDGTMWAHIPDDDTLDLSGELTLECWVKADFNHTGSIYNALFSMNGDIATSTGLGLYTNDTNLYYRLGGFSSFFAYTADKWYYLAVTRDSSNNVKFYKGEDGVISQVGSTGVNSTDFTSTEIKYVGRGSTANPARLYKNVVDEPKVYNKGLTLDQITNNYKASLSNHKTGSSFSDDFSSDYGF